MAAEAGTVRSSHFSLVPLDRRRARETARLHASELPPSFFGDLGTRFLRTYHRSFGAGVHGFARAAVDRETGVLLGFVVGTTEDAAHYRWVVRSYGLRLGAAAVASLVLQPRTAAHFVRTRLRRYLRGASKLASSSGPAPEAGAVTGSLTHIAVAPAARGRGVGAALASAYVEAARASGADRVQAKTEASEGAAGFYEALGWRRDGLLADVDGKAHERYLLDL